MKAVNVKALDVRGITDITDTMVVASGTSDRHVKSIADRVVQRCKEAGFRPYGIEGERDGEWVLLDLQRRRAARDAAARARVLRAREALGRRRRAARLRTRGPGLTRIAGAPACACDCSPQAPGCRAGSTRVSTTTPARLRGDYRLELIEIPLGDRGSGDVRRAVETEGERMLAAAGERRLPRRPAGRRQGADHRAAGALARGPGPRRRAPVFCIGGPDGLAPDVDAQARLRWSLSALTLPHGLARVVVAEALYRAVSLIKGQPYHRA